MKDFKKLDKAVFVVTATTALCALVVITLQVWVAILGIDIAFYAFALPAIVCCIALMCFLLWWAK